MPVLAGSLKDETKSELDVPPLIPCCVSEAALLGGHAAGSKISSRTLHIQVGMVECVVGFGTQLQVHALGHADVLVNAQVGVPKSWRAESVAASHGCRIDA